MVATQTQPEVAWVKSTQVAVAQVAVIRGAGDRPAPGERSVSASENPQAARSGISRQPAPCRKPPPRPDAAARKEVELKEQYARDDELLDAILYLRDVTNRNPDLRQPDKFIALAIALHDHTFSILRIPPKNMAKLLVAFAELPDLRAGDLPEQIEEALIKRLRVMGQGEFTVVAATLVNLPWDSPAKAAVLQRGNQLTKESLNTAMTEALNGSAVKVSTAMENARKLCMAVVPYDNQVSHQGHFDDAALVRRLGGMLEGNPPQILPLREAFGVKAPEGRAGGKTKSGTKKTELAKAYARWEIVSNKAEKLQTENVILAHAVFEEAHHQFVRATVARGASAKITVTGHEGKFS
jgi:hypothetical protein